MSINCSFVLPSSGLAFVFHFPLPTSIPCLTIKMSTMMPARAFQTESAIISGIVQKHTNFLCRTQVLHSNKQRRPHSSKRNLHSTPAKDVAITLPGATLTPSHSVPPSDTVEAKMVSPLAALPLSHILRTYLITAMSSSPILLNASTSMLRTMLESKNPLFRIDTNPVMKMLLMKTFYKQFCAGGNDAEVAKTCAEVRQLGYSGVVLEYALEVLKDDVKSNELEDVAVWRKGMLDSIRMAAEGDFVALKWSGMGPSAMRRMAEQKAPTKEMEDAMQTVCESAAKKDIALLPSAEETWNLQGYHQWTLKLQRAFNRDGKCVMYNTYQLYLKQAPGELAQHLKIAKDEGFTLGAKLVRGAYLATEKRDLIWPTIEATHNAYNTVMTGLIKRNYNEILQPAGKDQTFPDVRVVVASHNSETVKIAQQLRREQASKGEQLTPLVYSQLQGMADEVSCSLLAAAKENKAKGIAPVEKVYKFTSWGSMFECLNYLLRRAAENKDAASRTGETKAAMQAEMWRRLKGVFGLA